MMIAFWKEKKWGRFGKKWGCFGKKWGVLVGGVLAVGRFDMYSCWPTSSQNYFS